MADGAKGAGRRTAAEAQATRQLIVSAALEQFAERGFDAVSVREIAAQAGVTHGMIRHHFGSKLDVWKAALEDVFEEYRQALLPGIQEALAGEDPLQAFQGVVSQFIRVSSSRPVYARLLVRESESTGERAQFCLSRFQEIHSVIGQLFERARDVSPTLGFHTNDSFFDALISLTFFRILHPSAGVEPEYPLDENIQDRTDLILAILFGQAQVQHRSG